MNFNVRIESNLPAVLSDAITFETGATRSVLEDQTAIAYEHHGDEFGPHDRGALTAFYEDLLLGRALPLTFATKTIRDVDTLTAIALFLHRDLATHPAMTGFVYSVDFVHRLGFAALAHVPEDTARFIGVLRNYFPEAGLSSREFSTRVTTAVDWIRDYIHNGTYPTLGQVPNSDVRVLVMGTTGFVLAETDGSLLDGWVELFRLGHLRGILVQIGQGDRRHIRIGRKSGFVPFDLHMAAHLLNQMETAMGELPDWTIDPHNLWLEGPQEGTLLLVQDVVQVLVRV